MQYAKGNVNKPKMVFWYIVGAIDFSIGLAIFLVLTFLLSKRHFAYRAIRLPSTIFIFFGVAQMYSAYRRFCSQVWDRKSAQLRPWEMDPGDEEQIMSSSEAASSRQGLTTRLDMIEIRQRSRLGEGMPQTSVPIDSEQGGSLPNKGHPSTEVYSAASASATEGLPWGRTVPCPEDDMDDEMRKRLAVRRDTLRAPDASVAFPIDEPSFPPTLSTPDLNEGMFATPFGAGCSDDTHMGLQLRVTAEEPLDHIDTRQTASKIPSMQDLRVLIRMIDTRTSGRPIGKPKMFGPERIVEDPRVSRFYDSVVRDIMIVGIVFGLVWVGVCFAVPTYG
jgi:hypothetical protein